MNQAAQRPTHAGTIAVGLVEDDPILREALAGLLGDEAGLRLLTVCQDGEQALQHLPMAPPDVVIMDIGLPGINGIECVRTLAPMLPHTQFLMYTTHDDDLRVFDALKAGANGYILKSSTPDEIIAAVRELLTGGAPMSTAVARRVVEHLRPGDAIDRMAGTQLTEREREVLENLAQGLLYKEIAHRLGISENTVRQHIHKIYEKLHVGNRTEAVNRYFGR
ncbi:MAG: response regulator transcription factor [Flavobacteriales bacterium]|nr:response regulator transcription factor [Flavobacteriales bacterium]